MHSLETGIVVSIAAFFFFSFLSFVFLRESNISKEVLSKYEIERNFYKKGVSSNYKPEDMNNVISIIVEEELINDGKIDE